MPDSCIENVGVSKDFNKSADFYKQLLVTMGKAAGLLAVGICVSTFMTMPFLLGATPLWMAVASSIYAAGLGYTLYNKDNKKSNKSIGYKFAKSIVLGGTVAAAIGAGGFALEQGWNLGTALLFPK